MQELSGRPAYVLYNARFLCNLRSFKWLNLCETFYKPTCCLNMVFQCFSMVFGWLKKVIGARLESHQRGRGQHDGRTTWIPLGQVDSIGWGKQKESWARGARSNSDSWCCFVFCVFLGNVCEVGCFVMFCDVWGRGWMLFQCLCFVLFCVCSSGSFECMLVWEYFSCRVFLIDGAGMASRRPSYLIIFDIMCKVCFSWFIWISSSHYSLLTSLQYLVWTCLNILNSWPMSKERMNFWSHTSRHFEPLEYPKTTLKRMVCKMDSWVKTFI